MSKLDVIFENKVVSKLKFSKNVNKKKCALKIIFFNKKVFLERFGSFLKLKIDFESQNFAIPDNFYSTDRKIKNFFKGLVIGFRPKGRPGRMCNSVR